MSASLVLVCNSRDKTIGLAMLSADGRLDDFATVPLPDVEGNNGPSPMAVSPDGRMLYVAFRGSPFAVLSFQIDYRHRTLSYLGKAPLPESMAYIATDRTGRLLFGASYGTGIFSVSRIGADGIAEAPLATLEAGDKSHCTIISPDNRVVLVPCVGLDQIVRIGFDGATGRIERLAIPAVQLPAGAGPRHLVLHPGGRFAYVVNQEGGSVTALRIGADMVMTPIETVNITPENHAGPRLSSDIHLTPDGSLLYASERESNTIAGFRVDQQSGRLTQAESITAPATPRGFAIDPTGRFLLSLGENTGTITSYAIDRQTGKLRQVQETKVGNGPNWVEILTA
ncbi:MAG TPA: lactonase family protein [Devosiaceae bacterium]|jgi:6-phosphogluconolactonase